MNPTRFKNLIDVTKPPYCADNTEKEDCTEILRRVLNDLLIREAEGIKKRSKRSFRRISRLPFRGTDISVSRIESISTKVGRRWTSFFRRLSRPRASSISLLGSIASAIRYAIRWIPSKTFIMPNRFAYFESEEGKKSLRSENGKKNRKKRTQKQKTARRKTSLFSHLERYKTNPNTLSVTK